MTEPKKDKPKRRRPGPEAERLVIPPEQAEEALDRLLQPPAKAKPKPKPERPKGRPKG